MVEEIESIFPNLQRSRYQVTSPENQAYNCVAWVAGDTLKWWWPDPDVSDAYWPPEITRNETLVAFIELFRALGYAPCEESEYEPDHERIAIFAAADGMPTHAAKQLSSGRWSSQLGKLEDIEHALDDICGSAYGSVVQIMKRPTNLS